MKYLLMLLLSSSFSTWAADSSGTGGTPEPEQETDSFRYCQLYLSSDSSGTGGNPSTEADSSGTGGDSEEAQAIYLMCIKDSTS